MAAVVNNFDNFIEYIVSAFEAEMHNVERDNIWRAIAARTPYSQQEALCGADGQARSMSNSETLCALLCGVCWGRRNSKQK